MIRLGYESKVSNWGDGKIMRHFFCIQRAEIVEEGVGNGECVGSFDEILIEGEERFIIPYTQYSIIINVLDVV